MSLARSDAELYLGEQDAIIIPFPRREPARKPSRHEAYRFGHLTSWAFAYIEYIYTNGDNNGRSMPKSSKPVVWERVGQGSQLRAEARGRVSYGSDSWNTDNPGALFVITHTLEQGEEILSLESDGYRVVNGEYRWEGTRVARPAPDATFAGVMSAHEAGITLQANGLLSDFKGGVSHVGDGLQMSGVWNRSLSVLPPADIVSTYVSPE